MFKKIKIISFFFLSIALFFYFFERKNNTTAIEYLNIFSDIKNLCNEEKNGCMGYVEFKSDFNELTFLEKPIARSNDPNLSSMTDSSNIFLEIEQDIYLTRASNNELYRNEGAFIDVDDDDSFFNRRIDLIVKNNGEFIEVEEYLSNRQAIDSNLLISETTNDYNLDSYLLNKPELTTISVGPFIDVDNDSSFINARE